MNPNTRSWLTQVTMLAYLLFKVIESPLVMIRIIKKVFSPFAKVLKSIYYKLHIAYYELLAYAESLVVMWMIRRHDHGNIMLEYADCDQVIKLLLSRGARILVIYYSGDEFASPQETTVMIWDDKLIEFTFIFSEIKCENDVKWGIASRIRII